MFLFHKSIFIVLISLIIIDLKFSMKTLRTKSNILRFKTPSYGLTSSIRLFSNNNIVTIDNNVIKNIEVAQLIGNDITSIQKSAKILINGGLVAFPTETVYGLGANAFNETAVQSIFITKKRPNSDPLIVHVKNKELMYDLFDFNSCYSSSGNKLAKSICEVLTESFWPGPLTIIYKAVSRIPVVVTANTGYVGIRCPNHLIALKLLYAADLPIAAPSANRFGHVSPTTSAHVMNDLGDSSITIIEDDIVATGGCVVGIESTICRIKIIEQSQSQQQLLPKSNNNSNNNIDSNRNIDSNNNIDSNSNIDNNNHHDELQVKAEISILRCGAITSTLIMKALLDKEILNCMVKIDNQKHLVQTRNKKKNKEEEEGIVSNDSNNKNALVNTLLTDSSTSSSISIDSIKEEDIIVAPGQMLRHYAPDLPTYIAILRQHDSNTTTDDDNSINGLRLDDVTSTIIKNDYKDIQNSMIIDYGSRLKSLHHQCKVYIDLSSNNNANDACFRLFDILRSSESQEMFEKGVTHVLLPDLRSLFIDKSVINNNINDNSSNNSSNDSSNNSSDNGNSTVNNDKSFVSSNSDGLERALWERMNRAASNTFVFI